MQNLAMRGISGTYKSFMMKCWTVGSLQINGRPKSKCRTAAPSAAAGSSAPKTVALRDVRASPE